MQILNPEAIAVYGDFMKPDELRDFLRRADLELVSAWPELQARWLARDWVALQKGAHRLKSVVGNVGCERLYQSLHALEACLRAAPMRVPGEAQRLQLQAEVDAASQALRAAAQAP